MLKLCLLLSLALVAFADIPKHLTWPMLAPFKGQWKINFALTRGADKSVFVPQNCSSQLITAPCNQPLMSKANDDRIQATFMLKNTSVVFTAFKNGMPQFVAAKICYTPHSFMDRPWRKLKKAIWKDKNCPYVIGKKVPFPADPYQPTTVTMNFNKTADLATATWYLKVVVYCKDGSSSGVPCQFDETNSTMKNYFGTQKENARQGGMIAAAIVMSCIGPVFFLVYFFVEGKLKKDN